MQPRQRKCIYAGVAVMVLMGLYPPWMQVFPGHLTKPLGYGWLFWPPSDVPGGLEIDVVRLLVQWAVVVALGVSALVLTLNESNIRAGAPTVRSSMTFEAGRRLAVC